jgi:hypothetical protein
MAYMTAVGIGRPQGQPPGVRARAAFDGGTESIAAARDFCAGFVRAATVGVHPRIPADQGGRLLGDLQLVVSELVTNACKYAPGPTALALEIRGPLLEITLWDTAAAPPTTGSTGPGVVGRHGLEIVHALCEDVAVRLEPVGKRITATLALHAGTPSPGAR